jgi:hypothetical protein
MIYPRADADGGPDARRAQIARSEQTFSVTFPPAYRDFLVAYGGGFPWPADVEVGDPRVEDLIGEDIVTIFEFHHPAMIETLMRGDTYADATPQGYIFLADANGVQILMSGSGADAGRLLLWRPGGLPKDQPADPELGERGNTPDDMIAIAQDFTSLLAMMQELPGSEVARQNWESARNRTPARRIEL